MDSKKLAAIMVTAVVAIACTRAGPPFESIWCPSTKVFDETTGECVTRCCSDCVLSDPRTPCDEDRCVSDPGYCMTGCGSENSAACTCDPPCLVDFVCNPIPRPPVCEAACATERCTPDTAYCNEATGACEERLPDTRLGEVGTPCTTLTECYTASGLQCYSEAEAGYPGGYCSKACATDLDCPSGSVCDDGICWDACDPALGDCLPGHSCDTGDGGGRPVCVP